jgi:ketosteroid isomerase-like protein
MKNGGKYDQKFCWICRFDNKIVEIGMYRDTAHIKETIEGNE